MCLSVCISNTATTAPARSSPWGKPCPCNSTHRQTGLLHHRVGPLPKDGSRILHGALRPQAGTFGWSNLHTDFPPPRRARNKIALQNHRYRIHGQVLQMKSPRIRWERRNGPGSWEPWFSSSLSVLALMAVMTRRRRHLLLHRQVRLRRLLKLQNQPQRLNPWKTQHRRKKRNQNPRQ